ncbi:CheR family methyltransferase [Gorillibacterium sp. sgz5001074]|uniref:CheR family methyltransferase n=1 Tax=Gorillibacterium sp. sgz5001074 TaxID=3446695 RepID=UPI003F6729FB
MTRISKKEFRALSDFIHTHYGIHLKEEKLSLLEGRLQLVLARKGMGSFEEFFEYLTRDRTGEAVALLVEKVTTNHTFFMREAEHFRFLQQTALPEVTARIRDKDLRIWSAGCSTGEEPYTLAMLLDEYFGKEKVLWDAKVLATDISDRVLDAASKGVYEAERIAALPSRWKTGYFRRTGEDLVAIQDRIKAEIIFRRFNLMEPVFPFKRKFHIIFCRNVMIYFDAATKAQLVRKFYDWTEDGGYLFIGQSESLQGMETGYRYVMPAVYRKG